MPLGKVDTPPKGEGVQAKATKITKDVQSMNTQPPVQLDHGRGDAFSNNFPAMMIPKDPHDSAFAMKSRNTARNPINGGAPVQTLQYITKDDEDFQKRKGEVVNNLKYQTWLTNNINLTNPKEGKKLRKAVIRKPTRALNASVRAINKPARARARARTRPKQRK